MNKRITFLIGAVMVLMGIVITILFDIQPYITSTITFLGLGIITITASKFLSDRNMEQQ